MERQIAYKFWIGALIKGKINVENERFTSVEIGNKKISRINIIANVIDKYSDELKPYVAITLDDASGQIRAKAFADSVNTLSEINIGDTILIVGMLRVFNNELYILPEIVRIVEPKWAMVRKLELIKEHGKFDAAESKTPETDNKKKVLNFLKQNSEGIEIDKMIMQLSDMEVVQINNIITELISDGLIYEPMPGKLRSI